MLLLILIIFKLCSLYKECGNTSLQRKIRKLKTSLKTSQMKFRTFNKFSNTIKSILSNSIAISEKWTKMALDT
jgi:hypothetical protein